MSTKITKALIAALVLAGASITFVANASAAPTQRPSQAEHNWMDRASAPDTEYGYPHGGGR
jgi:Spy/CpxP family protein refolding chaperone